MDASSQPTEPQGANPISGSGISEIDALMSTTVTEEEEASQSLNPEQLSGATGGPPAASAANNNSTSPANSARPSNATNAPPPGVHIRFGTRVPSITIHNNRRVGAVQVAGPNVSAARPNVHVSAMPAGPPLNVSGQPIPLPRLPPLQPQPVPNQGSGAAGQGVGSGENGDAAAEAEGPASGTGSSASWEKQLKKLECAICFEYMDQPVGCGNCQTRCCRVCLVRVLQQATNNRRPDSDDPPNAARCPFCRSLFTLGSIKLDTGLQRKIRECTETVTCPFAGCGTELKIGLLKAHEATCPYMRVRCRYAEYGCEWVGTKKDVGDHDRDECSFRGGVGRFVEQFRHSNAMYSGAVHQLQYQLAATNRMLHFQGHQLMITRAKLPTNFFHVLEMSFVASCFPTHFSVYKDLWHPLIRKDASRCSVCNILYFLPSAVLILHVMSHGFRLFSRLQLDPLLAGDSWGFIDMILLSCIMGLLAILCIACFYIDKANSMEWTTYNVRDIIPGQPLVRDVAACSMAMIHFCAIEFFGWHPGILLWHSTTVPTLLFTSFLSSLVENNNESTRMVLASRARPVVLFGLRYGFLASCCGLAPTITSVIGFRLIKSFAKIPAYITSEDSECFISQFNKSALGLGAIVGVSFYSATCIAESTFDPVIDLLFGLLILGYLNVLIFLLQNIGDRLGKKCYVDSIVPQNQRSAEQLDAILSGKPPDPIGASVLGLCSFLLLCIIVA